MKSVFSAAVLASALAQSAYPQSTEFDSISIKDLHLGIDSTYLVRTPHKLCDATEFALHAANCFTVGGSPITNLIGIPEDSKIIAFRIDFASSNYEAIKSAIISKYPSLNCTHSTVQNRMGAKFLAEDCTYITARETLSLQKYGSELTTGWVFVASNTWLEKQKDAQNKKKGDI